MDRVLIDDVTLAMLKAGGHDVDGWLRSLNMVGWDPEPTGCVPGISRGTINGFLREPAVHDTHVALGEGVTYTRGDTRPGPQIVIADDRLPSSVLIALIGQSVRRLVDHPALTDAKVMDVFRASGHLYVTIDVTMTSVATSIPIADIKARMMERWANGRLGRRGRGKMA